VPTALELAGVTKPTTIGGKEVPPSPGRSLVPAFAADGGVKHDYLWWFHDGNRAVRLGDWKLVAAEGDPWELYDLSTDRTETKNLASSDPAKVRELEAEWQRHADEFTALVLKEPGVTKTPPKAKKKKN
jgi:arylsulfatase